MEFINYLGQLDGSRQSFGQPGELLLDRGGNGFRVGLSPHRLDQASKNEPTAQRKPTNKDEPARWRYTCGDPVCVGYTVKPGVTLCTSQVPGGRCGTLGVTCDPRDDCNRLLVCSVEEPSLVPCPDVP